MYKKLVSALSLIALLATAACAVPPKQLDLSLSRPTVGQKFVATLVAPTPPAALNAIHSWQIKLASPDGQPIRGARVDIDGGMPQHGHGLPSRPQVTKELADGTYLLEGMKFSMTGWWEIRLAISTADASDHVTFNAIVLASGAIQ